MDVLFASFARGIERMKSMHPAEEPYADRVNQQLAPIAGWVLEERIPYDCPWDDFRFNHFRGKDSDTAARELVAWAHPREIKVEFDDLRREGGVDVIYVFLTAC